MQVPGTNDELRALREQIRRDEEALATIEAALARIPQSVRDQVAIAAQQPERYGLSEFVAYMRSWMTARNLFSGLTLAYSLYGLYLSKYAEVHSDGAGVSSGPRAGGPFRFYAPADGSGSVVDAVFAKADKAEAQRARAPMRA
jgi:hypothetical protein